MSQTITKELLNGDLIVSHTYVLDQKGKEIKKLFKEK